MSLHETKITFIGAGNMAKSIAIGLINAGVTPANITFSAPASERLEASRTELGITTTSNNCDAVKGAHVLVLAVKPAKITEVCQEIAVQLAPSTLVVSVAAGITCRLITDSLSSDTNVSQHAIVRSMPNTPSMVAKGASGLFANDTTTDKQKHLAEAIMAAVGLFQWVNDEQAMDTITALSGSGPAYFFLFMEAMVDSAVAMGLNPEAARTLAIQTAAGAAELAASSQSSLAELRKNVTSPNGTTEKAINTFEAENLRVMVNKAMQAAKDRAQALSKEFAHSN